MDASRTPMPAGWSVMGAPDTAERFNRKALVDRLHRAVDDAAFDKTVAALLAVASNPLHPHVVSACQLLYGYLLGKPREDLTVHTTTELSPAQMQLVQLLLDIRRQQELDAQPAPAIPAPKDATAP